MLTLYDASISGNCYKVRLLLSFLKLEYKLVAVDLKNREQKTPDFLKLNIFGEVPVLKDKTVVIRDSQAILVYLAKCYGSDAWLPDDAEGLAKVMQWLSTAANEIANSLAPARAYWHFERKEVDIERSTTRAAAVLEVMNNHLHQRNWLEFGRPTIADIACFPYIALAHQGKISLNPYPNVLAWTERFKHLPQFIEMAGIDAPQ